MKTLFFVMLASIIFVSPAEAGRKKKDPNLDYEGHKVMVKRAACLGHGGAVTEEDKRYFLCEGGKYDGYITSGPAEDMEGDKDEEL